MVSLLGMVRQLNVNANNKQMAPTKRHFSQFLIGDLELWIFPARRLHQTGNIKDMSL